MLSAKQLFLDCLYPYKHSFTHFPVNSPSKIIAYHSGLWSYIYFAIAKQMFIPISPGIVSDNSAGEFLVRKVEEFDKEKGIKIW